MTETDLRHVAQVCSVLLVVWELIGRRIAGAALSVLAAFCLFFVTHEGGLVVSIVLAVPVVFEERWNPRARKDLLRGALAAGLIAAAVGLLLVY